MLHPWNMLCNKSDAKIFQGPILANICVSGWERKLLEIMFSLKMHAIITLSNMTDKALKILWRLKAFNLLFIFGNFIVCNRVSPPVPQKHYPLFLAKPPLNLQTVQAPLFRQAPLYVGFLWPPPPLKIGFFSEPQKYWSLSFLTPSYLN